MELLPVIGVSTLQRPVLLLELSDYRGLYFWRCLHYRGLRFICNVYAKET
jgi:hypothetical protein